MFGIFALAIKFDCLFLGIFQKLHKTTKKTTRVPEISQLRAGNHSDSNGKGENNDDQQACR